MQKKGTGKDGSEDKTRKRNGTGSEEVWEEEPLLAEVRGGGSVGQWRRNCYIKWRLIFSSINWVKMRETEGAVGETGDG